MVEIKSQSQEEEIEDYRLSVSQDREHAAFWIGLNDLILEGIYDFLHLHNTVPAAQVRILTK